jgi:hypothetical protein
MKNKKHLRDLAAIGLWLALVVVTPIVLARIIR